MNQQTEDIKAIRRLMEQSSKFVSFNGLSIVVAGIIACVGAAFAYFFLMNPYSFTDFDHNADVRPLLLLAD
ncbi:MAG: hypothetical protein LBR75_03940, partial [Prevotellaceae bacterium]|nr:hypothetical protein [Prevotellaceae bacterium]